MDDIMRALPSAGMINARPSGSPATGPNAVAPSKDRDRLDKACGDFEAIFVQQLFKTMRASVPESALFNGGRAEEIYTAMLDQHVAENMAHGESGIGLAHQMRDKLARYATTEPVIKKRY